MTRRADGDETWRDGGSVAAWPAAYPSHLGDNWPNLSPSQRWVPERDAAAVVCFRTDNIPAEVVNFGGLNEAAEAVEALYRDGCGPQCCQRHVICWTVAGQGSYVASLRCDPPVVPRDLSSALVAAGYRRVDGAEHWPTPSVMNPVLYQARKAPR